MPKGCGARRAPASARLVLDRPGERRRDFERAGRLCYAFQVASAPGERPDSSVVEHFHGKEGVVSSILTRGSAPGGAKPLWAPIILELG